MFDIAQGLRDVQGMSAESVRKILETAKATFEQLAESAPDDADLQRSRSVMLNEFGDTYLTLGDLEQAFKVYRDGLVIAERLAAADPANTKWQRDLWVSYSKVGDVLVEQGKLDEALKAYRDGLAVAERLAASDPANLQWQHDLTVSYVKIGDVLVAQGKLDEALKTYRDGLAIRERLAAADPGKTQWQRDLAVAHNRIGDVLVAQGKLDEALEAYRDDLAIAERLAAADRTNTQWQRDLSVSHNKIGDVLMAQGKLEEALAGLPRRPRHPGAPRRRRPRQYAVAARSGGVAREGRRRAAGAGQARRGAHRPTATASSSASASPPPTAAMRSGSAICRCPYSKIGDVLVAQGKLDEALKAYRDDLVITERLAAADRSNTQWQRDLSVSYDRIGDVLVAQGKLDEALKAYRDEPRHPRAPRSPPTAATRSGSAICRCRTTRSAKCWWRRASSTRRCRPIAPSLAIRERLAAADGSNTQWQRDLSVSYNKIGNVLVARGRLDEALKAYRDAPRHPGAPGRRRSQQHAVATRSVGVPQQGRRRAGGAGQARRGAAKPTATASPSESASPPPTAAIRDWQRDLAVSYSKIGSVLVAQGKLDEALEAYRADLAIAERLAAADAGNTKWQRDLAVSYNKVGDVLKAQGKLDEALKAYRDGLAIVARLAAADPGNTEWQRDLSISHNRIGDLLAGAGRTRGGDRGLSQEPGDLREARRHRSGQHAVADRSGDRSGPPRVQRRRAARAPHPGARHRAPPRRRGQARRAATGLDRVDRAGACQAADLGKPKRAGLMEFLYLLGMLLLAIPIIAIIALVKTIMLADQMRRIQVRLADLERAPPAPARTPDRQAIAPTAEPLRRRRTGAPGDHHRAEPVELAAAPAAGAADRRDLADRAAEHLGRGPALPAAPARRG